MTGHPDFKVWLGVAVAVGLALTGWVYSAGIQSSAIAQNTKTNDAQDSRYVPRTEIDAKLENIQLQVQTVNEKVGDLKGEVGDLKEQSIRQTAEIIRSIERATAPSD